MGRAEVGLVVGEGETLPCPPAIQGRSEWLSMLRVPSSMLSAGKCQDEGRVPPLRGL